jgi:hypothetical protein
VKTARNCWLSDFKATQRAAMRSQAETPYNVERDAALVLFEEFQILDNKGPRGTINVSSRDVSN